ncbi:MAG: formylglycine-generating enzyme family protein [Methylococcaceae bacterium]|nr:MAG: formylglycine-generating enzyme family protein [Methylococcaceae bacterium]
MAEPLSFVSIEWIKPLAKQLRKIRGQRAAAVTALSDEFGDPRLLLDYYVEPHCQHHNPADYHEDDGPRSAVKTQVFPFLNQFLAHKALTQDGGNQLFILADAGMGKTSLLLMLKLAHLFAFWPQGHACELLKLGQDSLERIAKLEHKADTVLLLDALDEDPLARGRIEQRLRKLLEATCHFHHVLITCRTQFFPATGLNPLGDPCRVKVDAHLCPMVFLSLFDDHQVEDYLRRRFRDPWHAGVTRRLNPDRIKAQALLRSMQSLRFRPLLLAYIEDLLKAEGPLDEPYRVYQALVGAWLLREIRKMNRQKLDPIPSEAELWDACRIVAVYLQAQDKRSLGEDELKTLIARAPGIAHLQYMDFGGRSLLNRNSARDYRFSHYSIQEFLVAHALREGCLEQDLNRCSAHTSRLKLRVTAQMFDFLRTGLDQAHVLASLSHMDGRDLPQISLVGLGISFHDPLRNGGCGPEMLVVPAGDFIMGSAEEEFGHREEEQPPHPVIIRSPFALCRYPVTFMDYDLFCTATDYELPSDHGWGRGLHPVINVSWFDVQIYAAWLSEQTGKRYRLPSEAEWEYALRAGSSSAFFWGEAEQRADDYAWYECNSQKMSHPVGEKRPNAWGLYDMNGNVWEWTADHWHANYQGAPGNEVIWRGEGKSDDRRVFRGGSWYSKPEFLRSASRYRDIPGYRHCTLGFRLAQDLYFTLFT